MIGRLRLAEEVQARLDKPSPDHVSVLGPALYGKSVLLQEIAARYAPGRPGYLTSVYVDLRRRTPANDHELRERVAGKLQTALEKPWPEGAELLKFEDVAVAERLQLVGQELAKTDDTVLLVLDGFDDVLPNPGITRKVWDNLLRIAALPVFRYITGSRKPLRELCRTEDSRTSDFWEIFHDVPVMVDCFNERDWAELLAPFDNQNTTLDAAARERLDEWTGSVPVLCLALTARAPATDPHGPLGGLLGGDENRSRRPQPPPAAGTGGTGKAPAPSRAAGLHTPGGQAAALRLPADGALRGSRVGGCFQPAARLR
jgi:hypothetical protein